MAGRVRLRRGRGPVRAAHAAFAMLALGMLVGMSAHARDMMTADQAVAFLQKVQAAARSLDYSGVYTWQQGSAMQSSRLVHVVDGKGERERLEVLDGEPREVLRQGSTQRTLIPGRKLVLVQTVRNDHFPSLLLGDPGRIPRHYTLQQSGDTWRVAGRDCVMSELQARDALRYSYRLCTDTRSHLLLKAQTLDGQGRIMDQIAFGSVQIGKEADVRDLDSRWSTRDWHQLEEPHLPIDLAARGWRFIYPDGFEPLTQISRAIRPGHMADQLVLSDGLAAISVFVETFDPERDQSVRQGGMSHGAIHVYRKRVASFWLTAVGEVPAQTVQELVQAVQYVPRAAH